MNQDGVKLVVGLVLLGLWTALVVFKVQGADELIGAIKAALTGLSAHYLTNFQSASSTPPVATATLPKEVLASPLS